jgi:hypothetical protein
MQTVANPHRDVTVRVLRPFLMNGEILAVGDELKIAFVDARYLEHTSKAQIVSDPAQPETEAEPAAEQLPAKKGKKHA